MKQGSRAWSLVKLLNIVCNTNDRNSKIKQFLYGIYCVLNKKKTSVMINTGERIKSRIMGKNIRLLNISLS